MNCVGFKARMEIVGPTWVLRRAAFKEALFNLVPVNLKLGILPL